MVFILGYWVLVFSLVWHWVWVGLGLADRVQCEILYVWSTGPLRDDTAIYLSCIIHIIVLFFPSFSTLDAWTVRFVYAKLVSAAMSLYYATTTE